MRYIEKVYLKLLVIKETYEELEPKVENLILLFIDVFIP